MKAAVEKSSNTPSDTKAEPNPQSERSSNEAARPKANPEWMKQHKPTLELPASDSPRPGSSKQQDPKAMNNVDLIDHAFSTPTSATSLTSGFYSSGSETPLLGLAGLSAFTEREKSLDSVCSIFDKMALSTKQAIQTPPPVLHDRSQGMSRKVSFEVQPMLSPLSAKPYHPNRHLQRDFLPQKTSVWENSLDNEEELIKNVKIQHEQERIVQQERYVQSEYRTNAAFQKTLPGKSALAQPYVPKETTSPSYFAQPGPATLKGQPMQPGPAMSPSFQSKSFEQQLIALGFAEVRRDGQDGMNPAGHMGHPHPDSLEAMKQHNQQYGDRPVLTPHSQLARRDKNLQRPTKPAVPLTCFACRGVGHKATQCPTHPRPVVATSSSDVIVNCAIHGKPRTSKNMFFNNDLGVWQCFSETECKSMIN